MSEIGKVKKLWGQRALEFINDPDNEMGNTLYDENLRRLEIEAILKYIPNEKLVLDVGCGNGFSTINFCKAKNISITGIDYSEEMISNANKLKDKYAEEIVGEVEFYTDDIMKPGRFKSNYYNIIISERCLINLISWENQMKAIKSIHKMLKPGGIFLMLEGFINNLLELNKIRELYNLKPIDVVWHNNFFEKQKFENFISKMFTIQNIDNFGSTYMLITRSLFHVISDSFDKNLDYLATKLPNLGNYNYQQLYVLIKI